MQIEFNEKKHQYKIDGDIAHISVTELLHKHGLAPNYDGVNKKTLKDKADKGKAIHKDLENIFKVPNYEPTTKEGNSFLEWVKRNVDCGTSEQMLGLDYKEMKFAGTCDVMGFLKTGETFIADHKTTANFDREYVSWQVSILDYFARNLGQNSVNGKQFNWGGALKFYCFHYVNGELSVKLLKKVSDKEIEKLLECEYNHEIYQRPNLVIDPELEQRFLTAEEYLISVEQTFKKAQENAKKLRAEMLSLFEKQNIQSWESKDRRLKVTYIPQIDKMDIDRAKLKESFPQAYAKCQKIIKQKPQIRVKVRDEEDED